MLGCTAGLLTMPSSSSISRRHVCTIVESSSSTIPPGKHTYLAPSSVTSSGSRPHHQKVSGGNNTLNTETTNKMPVASTHGCLGLYNSPLVCASELLQNVARREPRACPAHRTGGSGRTHVARWTGRPGEACGAESAALQPVCPG